MNYSRILIYCLCPVFAFSQPANNHCQEALELFCGDELWVDLYGATNALPEFFNDCGPWETEPGVWYTITGTGDFIHLSTCNDYSLNLKVFSGDCDSIACLSPIANFPTYQCDADEHKEVAFLSEYGTSYYIYCRRNSTSSFGRLQVNCYAPLANDICQEAKPIILDSTYTYDHRFGNPSYHNSCLDNFYQNLTDGWYTFQGNGDYIQIDNFSDNLLNSCLIKDACNSMEFVSSNFISGDRAYLTEQGATYFLQIVNHNLQPQQMRLRSFQRAGNDLCIGAEYFPLQDTLTISFNNTVSSIKACTSNEGTYDRWYYFTGNDSIVTFTWRPYTSFTGTRVKILTGTCDSLVCETMTRAANQVSIPTISGKRYWVNIHNSNAYEFETPVEVTATVTAPLENDEYTGAIPLQCGDTLQSTLAYALEDQAINGFIDVRSVWYRVIGTGEYYAVNADHPLQSFEKRFFTRQEGELVQAPRKSGYTYLKKDSVYFLNITGSYNTVFNDFELSLGCQPVDDYDSCTNAMQVSVADTILGQMQFTLNNTFDTCSSYGTQPDVWYQFTGDGRLRDLTFENLVNDQVFGLLRGNCDSLSCITHWFNYFNEPATSRRIFFEKDVSYYLKVQGRRNDLSERKFRFYFQDLGPADNNLCHNAQLVFCGDTIRATLDYTPPCDYADPCLGPDEKRVWYELIGNGQLTDISLSGYGYNEQFLSTEIYEGDCCNLPRIEAVSNDAGHQVFLAEEGQKYLIAVRIAVTGYGGGFDLHIDCTTAEESNRQVLKSRSLTTTSTGTQNLSATQCPAESLACLDTIKRTDPHLYNQVFDAAEAIISSAELDSQTTVFYRAGNQITLLPGFRTTANCNFKASIQACLPNPSMNSTSSDMSSSRMEQPVTDINSEKLALEIFPNPFNQEAIVRFNILESGHVNLFLHNLQGVLLRRLYTGVVEKGVHTIRIDGKGVPGGSYFLSLQTLHGTVHQKIVLIN